MVIFLNTLPFNFLHSTSYSLLPSNNPLTTQVQHIYMGKKDRCQAHIKLEEILMWTKGQNVYFIWEMFSNAISLLYCVHSLGLRHISLTRPTQQIANGADERQVQQNTCLTAVVCHFHYLLLLAN
jgi:hypothetical protein